MREIDIAGRFGGEEFLLLLPGTDAAGAANVAERVRAALAERVIVTPGRRCDPDHRQLRRRHGAAVGDGAQS